MGYKNAFCDDCTVDVTGANYNVDYDHYVRCRTCYLTFEIKCKTSAREKKMEWLENTHLKDIRTLDEEIKEMQAELAQ